MAEQRQTFISSFFTKKLSPSSENVTSLNVTGLMSPKKNSELPKTNQKNLFLQESLIKLNYTKDDKSETNIVTKEKSEETTEVTNSQQRQIEIDEKLTKSTPETDKQVKKKRRLRHSITSEPSNDRLNNTSQTLANDDLFYSEDEIEDVEFEDQDEIRVSANSAEGKNALTKLMSLSKSPQTLTNTSKKSKTKGQTAAATAKINWFACDITDPDCLDITSPQFDPKNYNIDQYQSKKNNKMLLFEFLSKHFDMIDQLKGSGPGSKKSTVALLTNVFRCLIYHSPNEVVPATYISLNKVAPNYMGVELGVGESLIIKAMTETYGRTESNLKKEMNQIEDLGAIAELCSCKMRTIVPTPRLSISSTFTLLKSIAETSGHNSQQKKKDFLKRLLVSAKGSEPKYIVRFLQQTMRIGMNTATVYQSLAFAFWLTRPNLEEPPISDARKSQKWTITQIDENLIAMEKAVRTALCEVPNIEIIINHLLKGADHNTLSKSCVITPGVPVQPMLAKPTKGLSEVLDRFSSSTFTCEYKYDGERAQIHMTEPGKFKLFSRRLEEMTTKYPDVLEILFSSVPKDVTDFIIDSEVVAYDVEANKILPFQILSTRKRKQVEASEITVKIFIFPFDCIRFNGESLLSKSLRDRRLFLQKALKPIPNKLSYATHKEMISIEEMDVFLQEAIENSCEGLMVKTLDENASYEPFKRSLNWLKVKKDYIEGLSDSVDLVPIGAFFGRGKRNSLYGTYLLAVYNDVDETFQSVCKVATGFSDEDLQTLYNFHKDRVISKKPIYYETSDRMEPDVWFEPSQVWECRAADLSLSPVHTAAIGIKLFDKGIGLRFPRFLKVRDDKGVYDATNNLQILEMYDAQFKSSNDVTRNLDLRDDSDSEDIDF